MQYNKWILAFNAQTYMGAIIAVQDTELLTNNELAVRALSDSNAHCLYEGTLSECKKFIYKNFLHSTQCLTLQDMLDNRSGNNVFHWFISKDVYPQKEGIHLSCSRCQQHCCVAIDVSAGKAAVLAYTPDCNIRKVVEKTVGKYADIFYEGNSLSCFEFIRANYPNVWLYDYTNHIFI